MERLACVDFPEFPLQLLLLRHPEWKRLPAAVVAHDKPQSEILWVSPEARTAGVLPGMRYAQGLSLAADLRAAEVPTEEVQTEIRKLADLLRLFSPEVEISDEEPGVFWANADGLLGLFSSLDLWAQKIHAVLTSTGLRVSVVVGFRRFAVYAIAKGQRGILVLDAPEEENAALYEIPLSVLVIDPRLLDTLAKLGVHTVGEFTGLPAGAIRRRFGNEAARLHALALGDAHDPLTPVFSVEPATCTIFPDTPEDNSVRLLFAIQKHLHLLLAKLAKQSEILRELEVCFHMDAGVEDRGTHLLFQSDKKECPSPIMGAARAPGIFSPPSLPFYEGVAPRASLVEGATRAPINVPMIVRIHPAEPTLDGALILDLLRLKLEGNPLSAPAREIQITAHGVPGSSQQIRLFLKAQRRDLAAANRALARIRAELGEEVVVRARLTDEHLPEARFTWEPLPHLSRAHPNPEGKPGLVRRLYSRPSPLRMTLQQTREGQPGRGQAVRSWGPYVLSGGWWQNSGDHEIHRRYYFLETPGGKLLWVYYDGRRQCWFLQGQVE